LSIPDPDGGVRRQVGHKGLDQGGFADPGLPCDEEQLAAPVQGAGPPGVQLRQLGLPPDD
jgi:hypothetical protein